MTYMCVFILNSVNMENARSFETKLKDLQVKPVFEAIDLKLSAGSRDSSSQEKLDVRLKLMDKKVEVMEIRMNERKVAVFDICCLDK